MRYLYVCPACKSEHVIAKSVSQVDRIERCYSCKVDMKREITSCYFAFKDSKEYTYQPAFGKYTRTERDIKEQILKANYERGQRIEHVGDAQPSGDGPKEHKVDMQDAAEHFRSLVKQENRKKELNAD